MRQQTCPSSGGRLFAEAKAQPLWPSMDRALGLRPSDDWLADEREPQGSLLKLSPPTAS
jgi:hypothetical protein